MSALPVDADDRSPIVILDRAADVDALPDAARPSPSLALLRDLQALGERHLQTPAGMAALQSLDLGDPDVVAAYRLGYLPPGVRDALSPEARQACQGLPLANAVILPAIDAGGTIVDVVCIPARARAAIRLSCWAEPRGLVGGAVARLRPHVAITNMPRWLGRLWRQGVPALLVRGAANLAVEAARIAADGVRRADLRWQGAGADAIAAALQGVGITVGATAAGMTTRLAPLGGAAPAVEPERAAVVATAVAPPPAPLPPAPPAAAPASELELVTHDAAAELAIVRAGSVQYQAQVPWSDSTVVDVVAEAGGQRQRDRLDLAIAAQRLRFAAVAGTRLGIAPAVIAQDLQRLLPLLQGLATPGVAPAVRPSGDATADPSGGDRAAAMARLRDPDLLPGIAADLAALGCPGDADACALLALVAISRLGTDPLWLLLSAATPSERFPALDVLAAITPPEDLIHVSRLTDQALFNAAPDALRHRLLLIDEAAAIMPSVATALRILHVRGSLNGPRVERDPVHGTWRTRFVVAEGPLAVVTASAGDVPEALRADLLEVPAEAEPADACAPRPRLAMLRQGAAGAASIVRLQQLQRCLEPLPVLLPAEGRALPAAVAGMRQIRDAWVGLVAASSLLHQHQRLRSDGQLVATAADVAIATRLVLPLAARLRDDLSPRAALLLAALRPVGSAEFTMEIVAEATPSWPRSTRRRALEDLLAAEAIVALRGRQGQRRSYRLLATVSGTEARKLGHLATPGHAAWPGAAPTVATG